MTTSNNRMDANTEPPQSLNGAVDAETAYMVPDYPYGFRLRTAIRYWIETHPRYGQRMVSQTRNPKSGRWNQPKRSTYSALQALYLDADGHVQGFTLNLHAREEAIAEFEARFPAQRDDPYTRETLRYLRASNRAHARMTWTATLHKPGDPAPRQTLEEQRSIVNRAIRHELWQDTLTAIHVDKAGGA